MKNANMGSALESERAVVSLTGRQAGNCLLVTRRDFRNLLNAKHTQRTLCTSGRSSTTVENKKHLCEHWLSHP